ncbi:MAG: hypothetical protein ACE5QF_02750 [Thermoplasmata archaeon]
MRARLRGILSGRKLIALFLSLSFVFGTAALTYAQGAVVKQSVTVKIFDDGNLIAWLTIHHYTINPNFANMHAILKVQNNYDNDIFVEYLSVESWSDDKTDPKSVMYGADSKTDIPVPAGETVVMRINEKVYHFGELIEDDDVWSYSIVTWTHGGNHYSKSQITHTDATYWWHQLYP